MSTFFVDRVIRAASRLWQSRGYKPTALTRLVDTFVHLPLPLALSYEYGHLYGWNIHEKLHNPEPETVAFFKESLKPGDHVADIGANIGYYTLLFSRLVGESGKVVAFEPSPHAYARLRKAVRDKKNVELINKGVYSSPGVMPLYARRKGDPMASVVYQAGSRVDQVTVMPLREYPTEFTWAKVDAEGAEIEILRSMRAPTQVVLEVATGIQESYRGGIKKFFSDIEALGYTIYFIVDGGATIPYNGSNLDQLHANIYIKPTTS